MSKVSVMGTLTCQEGKADEMAEVLTAMVEAASGDGVRSIDVRKLGPLQPSTAWRLQG